MSGEVVLVAAPDEATPLPAAILRGHTWDDFVAAWLPIQDRLFRVALLTARNRMDAEDALADAMAATFTPWRNGRVEALEPYARRAVINRLVGRGRRGVVANRFRRTRRGDERGGIELADQIADRDALRDALSDLPPRQRAVVVLRYYAEMSVAEVADALGCSQGTVKSQAHDALAALRHLLEDRGGEDR